MAIGTGASLYTDAMGESDSQPLSDMPHHVRPIVPPPPPTYSPATGSRTTGPLKLRDTRPLAWTEVAQKLGQVEPLAIEGASVSRKKGWALPNPLDALRKKLREFRKP